MRVSPRAGSIAAGLFAVLVLAPAAEARRDLYVAGALSGAVAAHQIAPSGALTPIAGSPFAAGDDPEGVAITPDGRHLYTPNNGDANVTAYELAGSGALTPVAGSPFPSGTFSWGVAATPDGRHLYVANSGGAGSVSAYEVAPSGALTPVAGSPFASGGFPMGVAATPDGRHLYVVRLGGTVAAFEIAASGALTPLAGSPFAADNGTRGVAVAPDGRHLYVADGSSDNVLAYEIAASGALTQITGSPFLAGDNPNGVAVSPDGRHLYAANESSDNVSAYEVAPSGALTPVAGSPFVAGVGPTSLAVTPDGRGLYIAGDDGGISAYEVAPSGALVPLAGSPFASGVIDSTFQSLAITPDQPPVAEFTVAAGEAGQGTSFDATATTDPDGTPARFDWDFGDGTTLADGGPSPSHTYAAPGDFTATLTVTDDEGCSTELKYTGQTASCNGGPGARATRALTVSSPEPPVDPTLEITGVERDRKAGTATLTAVVNVAGGVWIAKTNKVKRTATVDLTEAGAAELEVIPRNKAAETLRRNGRLKVNPQVRFGAVGGHNLAVRHEFELRRD